MINLPRESQFLEKFSKNSKIVGSIFLIIGLIGIIFPPFLSLATAYFIAWMLIFSAFVSAYYTFKTNKKDWLGWLKAFIFGLTGILIAIDPLPGVAALGIIFAVYFFLDSFASFVLAFELKGEKWWWLALVNGLFSIVVATIILAGWPFYSLWIVGFLVGVSLFFDGVVILSLGNYAKKLQK